MKLLTLSFDLKFYYKKIMIVSFIIFIVVVFSEIWAVNRLSTYGAKLSQLKQTEVSLEMENIILEDQLAKQSALTNLAAQVKSLGFDSVKTANYIKPEVIASRF